jgi:SHS2 domain-containing protein
MWDEKGEPEEKGKAMKGFNIFGTTADEGMELWADSIEGIFESAVEGFASILVGNPKEVSPREERKIKVSGEDETELLVGFVNEMIFLFDAHKWIPSLAKEIRLSPGWVEAILKGERYNPAKHPPAVEVKAATYHLAEVKEMEGLWKATVVVDL